MQGEHISKALEGMLKSNRQAAEILRQHGSLAMTDITGFGLLGHLNRLLLGVTMDASDSTKEHSDTASGEVSGRAVGARIALENVPILEGAQELSARGIRSSLWLQNQKSLSEVVVHSNVNTDRSELLLDPQTSGGLLAIVPKASYAACVDALVKAAYSDAMSIGHVQSRASIEIMHDSKA